MIKTFATLRIGHFHTNYCEDFWVSSPIGTNRQLIAVLDGCTMGTESAFVSMLFGKTLRQISQQLYYQDFLTPTNTSLKAQLKQVLHLLFEKVKHIKNQLGLDTHELLSTLVLAITDEKYYQAEIITIGDGLICHDGRIIAFEQGERPDYLAYHLGKNFEEWFAIQTQRISLHHFTNLSICTDGIFSFRSFKKPQRQKSEAEIIDFLLINDQLSEHNNFLERKMNIIQHQWQYEVTDDLAIVRVMAIEKTHEADS